VSIEYTPEVLDEIRLSAVEAFYAFPHGGAEIGGVLTGSRAGDVVRIDGHRPLPCEHAFGPSFRLSPKDQARLEALLAEGRVVGWYHSHTRSGVLLSPQDLEVHERYFGDPWQVALVVRPSQMETRAGFFARDAAGGFRTESSYREFLVAPLAARPMVRPAPPKPETQPETESEPEPEPPSLPEPPRFLRPPEPKRRIPWRALAVVAGAIAVIATFLTRERWMPTPAPPTVSLTAYDREGTLQINWEWRSRIVRQARGAELEIADGDLRPVFPLSAERLRTGSYSYQRQSEKVHIRLRIHRADGSRVAEHLTFAGRLPPPRPSPLEKEIQQLRTDLIREKMLNEALQRELRKARQLQSKP